MTNKEVTDLGKLQPNQINSTILATIHEYQSQGDGEALAVYVSTLSSMAEVAATMSTSESDRSFLNARAVAMALRTTGYTRQALKIELMAFTAIGKIRGIKN